MKIEELEKYRDEEGYINIDEFEKDNSLSKQREMIGSHNREKFWIDFDDGRIMIRTSNLDKDGVEYSNYAELIFEELAKQVDIPCAHYDLIKYKGQKGVYTKNVLEKEQESLIHGKTLLENVDPKYSYELTSSIDDIFESYGILNKYDDVPKSQISKLCKSTAKMAIFDTYAMSTDRHSENFGTIFYSDGISREVRLSPMFDNECSLMLDQPTEVIDELMENETLQKKYVELQNQFIVVPEEQRDESYLDWEDTLFYLCDESEECMEFAEKCSKNLDIKKAMSCVEDRINAKLPEKLTDFEIKAFNIRKKMIEKSLCIDFEEVVK